MKNTNWSLMVFFFIAIIIIANGAFAGVEPSPFNELMPLIKNFRTEIAKANENFGRFDSSRGMNLYINNTIPEMQNIVKDMSSKAGVIGDCGNKVKLKNESEQAGVIGDCGMQTKMKNYIQKLNSILSAQKVQNTKKSLAINSLNEMETLLDKMEKLLK